MSLPRYRDPDLAVNANPIGFYEREFYVLSNFSSFTVEWRGRVWPTAEQAYHAAKFFDTAPDLVEAIFSARSAHDAFYLAKANTDKHVKNWEDMKIEVMRDICRHKLAQHEYIQKKLGETKGYELVEDSPFDDFWGWGADRSGRNELGKIWMQLRDELF